MKKLKNMKNKLIEMKIALKIELYQIIVRLVHNLSFNQKNIIFIQFN